MVACLFLGNDVLGCEISVEPHEGLEAVAPDLIILGEEGFLHVGSHHLPYEHMVGVKPNVPYDLTLQVDRALHDEWGRDLGGGGNREPRFLNLVLHLSSRAGSAKIKGTGHIHSGNVDHELPCGLDYVVRKFVILYACERA